MPKLVVFDRAVPEATWSSLHVDDGFAGLVDDAIASIVNGPDGMQVSFGLGGVRRAQRRLIERLERATGSTPARRHSLLDDAFLATVRSVCLRHPSWRVLDPSPDSDLLAPFELMKHPDVVDLAVFVDFIVVRIRPDELTALVESIWTTITSLRFPTRVAVVNTTDGRFATLSRRGRSVELHMALGLENVDMIPLVASLTPTLAFEQPAGSLGEGSPMLIDDDWYAGPGDGAYRLSGLRGRSATDAFLTQIVNREEIDIPDTLRARRTPLGDRAELVEIAVRDLAGRSDVAARRSELGGLLSPEAVSAQSKDIDLVFPTPGEPFSSPV